MSSFSTILIANRGEIAVRIARTARAMGLRTVAVYSDADAGTAHVRAADRAVHIGPAAVAQSYLDGRKLIEAARRTGADAVHPGYGFLAENAEFAEACAAAGLVFIGPSPAAIRAMGDKAAAKRLMAAKGVPCVPGYDGSVQDGTVLAAEAERVGFPLMLKAIDGGGGKGMRLIESAEQLAEGLASARSEAEKAFGSGRLMIEKAIAAPRHVEVQIFGDAQGNVVHLGDRDCSIQRRHQKIIEEAPAPALDADVRRAMAAAAVTAAQAIDYRGAGTVEFLVAGDAFYFLEMNTRLQVEHPVTEMVTGLDLVEWQFAVAAGAPLPLAQDEISLRGHAIEARLCAEDPAAGFLPQAGRIEAWQEPRGDGVRVDHALAPGTNVTTFYDPMLAKIISHGKDREQARRLALRAVQELFIAGIRTNQAFLGECLASSPYAAADLRTDFIDRHLREALEPRAPHEEAAAIAAALFHSRDGGRHERSLVGWRSNPWGMETLLLRSGDWSGQVEIRRQSVTDFIVQTSKGPRLISLAETEGEARAKIDGVEEAIRSAWHDNALTLLWRGICRAFEEGTAALSMRRGAEDKNLVARAPMPGVVARIHVSNGDAVRKGDVLLVLEAMKMEHLIRAPASGKVAAVNAAQGQQVSMRQALAEIEPA